MSKGMEIKDSRWGLELTSGGAEVTVGYLLSELQKTCRVATAYSLDRRYRKRADQWVTANVPFPWPNINPNLLLVDCCWVRPWRGWCVVVQMLTLIRACFVKWESEKELSLLNVVVKKKERCSFLLFPRWSEIDINNFNNKFRIIFFDSFDVLLFLLCIKGFTSIWR